MTILAISEVVVSSPRSIWFEHTTRFLSIPAISRRPSSPLLLASSSFLSCPSAYEALHKHFNNSWTIPCGNSNSVFLTWMTSSFFSRSLEEHEQHLRILFNRLQKRRILINAAKCVFKATKTTLLSYKVSAEGSRPLEERVAHLQTALLPRPSASFVAS
jgi:hypothetical protein